MAENNRNRNSPSQGNDKAEQSSIGNQQHTTQTGGQSAGGENIDQEEDNYTDDLRNSGNRNSSNRKNEEATGR